MIKVNLLKNRGGGTRSGTSQTEISDVQFDEAFDPDFDDASGGGQRDMFVKIIVMVMWVGVLYGYEWYNIGQLTSSLQRVQQQEAQLVAEATALKPQVEKAKVLQKENEELNKKLSLVKDLGRLRLREIRAIDHIQNIVPEKVWLSSLKFKDDDFEVVGLSANDQELDKLLDGIRENPTFKDVLLSRAVEEKSKQGNVKAFVITSKLSREP